MSNDRMNVVFFFADDQRFDTIAALGHDEVQTPYLDELVQRGTTFTRAHIPCGTSPAVCQPSRAMVHSGRGLFHIEGSGHTIPEEHTTFGEALKNAGYCTFGTGKWHNGKDTFNRSFSTGDEIFFGGMADHWNVPAHHYDPSGQYDATCPQTPSPHSSNEIKNRNCDHIPAGKHSSELVCDATIDFLQGYDEEKPFFAYVSFLAPHDPRTMPREYLEMYDPEEIELPSNFLGGHPFDTGALNIRDEMLAGFPRTPEETRRHIAEYYAMITHMDAQIGRVMETLKEQNEFDNTLFVFAGDNGLAVGQHGLFGKQNCYQHSVGVPLIFAGPGVPENEKRDDLVYLFDIYPTVCALTGVEIPDSVEGKVVLPGEKVDTSEKRDVLYFAYMAAQRAVRDDRYKLIEYAVEERDRVTQLFDLHEDPAEMNDFSDDPEYANKLQELREKLRSCAEEWDDYKSDHGQAFWERCTF